MKRLLILGVLGAAFHACAGSALRRPVKRAVQFYESESCGGKVLNAATAKDMGLGRLVNLSFMAKASQSDFDVAPADPASLQCLARRLAKEEHHKISPMRRHVVWVHLQNLAESFMCLEATRQGERTPENCVWPDEDRSQRKQAKLVSCAEKAKQASAYTFSIVNRELHNSDNCDGPLFGTILRDPIAAMESALVANKFNKGDILHTLKNNNSHPKAGALDRYNRFDNFLTRSLSGAFQVPPGALSVKQLTKAKDQLKRMDVLMVMEELSEHAKQLSHTFGWDVSHLAAGRHRSKALPGHRARFTEDEMKFLRDVNKYDIELYDYGRQLAGELSAAAEKIRKQKQ
eukprot:gb/GFBE01038879.1/.p1 GENE.gb/GFBE01038879.1/~~gb/GFBE01038879.1/.p1  ORF type:complete len:345 (+),score=84.42 gb/GFBE01038879.1/:1-1035(+)